MLFLDVGPPADVRPGTGLRYDPGAAGMKCSMMRSIS